MIRRLSALALSLVLTAGAAAAAVNVGVYSLVSTQVTAPLTALAQTPITDLDGMSAVTIEANFQYGSGGTSVSAVVQTTLDGTNWRDVARFDFTTASRVARANLSALTPQSAATLSALAAEGVNDGFLGKGLRAVLTSVGTYENTTLSVTAAVR